MAMHLVTGYAGEEHITAADQGAFNAAFFGTGQYVMEAGNMCEASITSNNNVRILDGDILMKGRHIRIKPNTYEDVAISTGTAGVNRNDLIVVEYNEDTTTGIETIRLNVIKGTETSGTPTDPAYTDGDVLGDATFNQMPLYRVRVQGVVLSAVEPMFETIYNFQTLADMYKEEFVESCETHLNSLGVLDTMEEVSANTQENQLAGALAVKELNNKKVNLVNITYSSSDYTNNFKKALDQAIADGKLPTGTSEGLITAGGSVFPYSGYWSGSVGMWIINKCSEGLLCYAYKNGVDGEIQADIILAPHDVVNNLTGTETNRPLSAKQGRVLNESKVPIVSIGYSGTEYQSKPWKSIEQTIADGKMPVGQMQGKIYAGGTVYSFDGWYETTIGSWIVHNYAASNGTFHIWLDSTGIHYEIIMTTNRIENVLTSTNQATALSSNMGRALNEGLKKCMQIVSFDESTGTLVTKSYDYTG